jgi:hypothetical protein
MDTARAEMHKAILLRQLIWLSIAVAIILFLGSITLCAVDLLTVGSAAAYAIAGIIFALVGGGLIAYVDAESISVVKARHEFENAQDEYFEVLQQG